MPETLPLIYLDYLLISFNEEKVIYFLLSTNILSCDVEYPQMSDGMASSAAGSDAPTETPAGETHPQGTDSAARSVRFLIPLTGSAGTSSTAPTEGQSQPPGRTTDGSLTVSINLPLKPPLVVLKHFGCREHCLHHMAEYNVVNHGLQLCQLQSMIERTETDCSVLI